MASRTVQGLEIRCVEKGKFILCDLVVPIGDGKFKFAKVDIRGNTIPYGEKVRRYDSAAKKAFELARVAGDLDPPL